MLGATRATTTMGQAAVEINRVRRKVYGEEGRSRSNLARKDRRAIPNSSARRQIGRQHHTISVAQAVYHEHEVEENVAIAALPRG